jgi:CRP/FNR family transcriptional regulator
MARGGRQPHCLHCRAAPFCIAVRVRASAAHAQLQTRRMRLIRDEVLFRPGDAAGNRFYALHYGAIKHTLANAVGQDKIVGFLMSGELLGLEAIASNRHKGCATAL